MKGDTRSLDDSSHRDEFGQLHYELLVANLRQGEVGSTLLTPVGLRNSFYTYHNQNKVILPNVVDEDRSRCPKL